MTLLNFKGQILTPDGWVDGTIQFDRKISSISDSGQVNSGLIILPGFVDLHVPGGGGGDCASVYDAPLRGVISAPGSAAAAASDAEGPETPLLPPPSTRSPYAVLGASV